MTRAKRQALPLRPLVDLGSIDPKDFRAATDAHGYTRALAEVAEHVDPATAVRGTRPKERAKVAAQLTAVIEWSQAMLKKLEEAP